MHSKDYNSYDLWKIIKNTVIFGGATFLSSISHCYFQAECTPSDYNLYDLWKNTVDTEDRNLVN